jgi:hypothetical protein
LYESNLFQNPQLSILKRRGSTHKSSTTPDKKSQEHNIGTTLSRRPQTRFSLNPSDTVPPPLLDEDQSTSEISKDPVFSKSGTAASTAIPPHTADPPGYYTSPFTAALSEQKSPHAQSDNTNPSTKYPRISVSPQPPSYDRHQGYSRSAVASPSASASQSLLSKRLGYFYNIFDSGKSNLNDLNVIENQFYSVLTHFFTKEFMGDTPHGHMIFATYDNTKKFIIKILGDLFFTIDTHLFEDHNYKNCTILSKGDIHDTMNINFFMYVNGLRILYGIDFLRKPGYIRTEEDNRYYTDFIDNYKKYYDKFVNFAKDVPYPTPSSTIATPFLSPQPQNTAASSASSPFLPHYQNRSLPAHNPHPRGISSLQDSFTDPLIAATQQQSYDGQPRHLTLATPSTTPFSAASQPIANFYTMPLTSASSLTAPVYDSGQLVLTDTDITNLTKEWLESFISTFRFSSSVSHERQAQIKTCILKYLDTIPNIKDNLNKFTTHASQLNEANRMSTLKNIPRARIEELITQSKIAKNNVDSYLTEIKKQSTFTEKELEISESILNIIRLFSALSSYLTNAHSEFQMNEQIFIQYLKNHDRETGYTI